jgi:hypothetical protein
VAQAVTVLPRLGNPPPLEGDGRFSGHVGAQAAAGRADDRSRGDRPGSDSFVPASCGSVRSQRRTSRSDDDNVLSGEARSQRRSSRSDDDNVLSGEARERRQRPQRPSPTSPFEGASTAEAGTGGIPKQKGTDDCEGIVVVQSTATAAAAAVAAAAADQVAGAVEVAGIEAAVAGQVAIEAVAGQVAVEAAGAVEVAGIEAAVVGQVAGAGEVAAADPTYTSTCETSSSRVCLRSRRHHLHRRRRLFLESEQGAAAAAATTTGGESGSS